MTIRIAFTKNIKLHGEREPKITSGDRLPSYANYDRLLRATFMKAPPRALCPHTHGSRTAPSLLYNPLLAQSLSRKLGSEGAISPQSATTTFFEVSPLWLPGVLGSRWVRT